MNPVYSDEYTRQILKPIAPEASPKKYVTPVSCLFDLDCPTSFGGLGQVPSRKSSARLCLIFHCLKGDLSDI